MSDQQKGKDLRNQLSELWRSTVEQLDGLKDVIVRQSHVGRKKIDTAVLRRQRDRFLQELGELVLARLDGKDLDLGSEGLRLAERIREIDEQIATAESEISRINQGETPESTGEFAAVQPEPTPDDEPTETALEPLEADGEGEEATAEADAEDDTAVDEDEASSDKSTPAEDEGSDQAAAGEERPKKRSRRSPRRRGSKARTRGDEEGED